MTEFESVVKTIPHSQEDVYRVLSDMRNIDIVKEMIPEDKIKDFSFDQNRVAFTVDAIGKVVFNVIDREPSSLIRFQSEKLPFTVNMRIELAAKAEKSTELQMIVESNLNPFMKGMVQKPMKDAIDRISDALSKLPYDTI